MENNMAFVKTVRNSLLAFIVLAAFAYQPALAADGAPSEQPAPAAAASQPTPAPAGGLDTSFACYQCHVKITPWITKTWLASKHAEKGIKCQDCHGNHDGGFDSPDFTPRPGPDKCSKCHPIRIKESLAGKHAGVTKCTSCHPRHTFSLRVARNPKICGTCHLGSAHVQSYWTSKMGVVYETEGAGFSATCQTCHMSDREHNVDSTLNNKDLMLKVCNTCHSASFAGKAMSSGSFKSHW
jgi:hypothetical protein